MKYKIILILFLTNPFNVLIAQQIDCDELYKIVFEEFDLGRYDTVISIINNNKQSCMQWKQQQQDIDILYITSMYEIDEPFKADSLMKLFFRTIPHFKPDINNYPPLFVEKAKTFRPLPIFSVYAKGGVNIPDIDVIKTFPVFDSLYASNYIYSTGKKPVAEIGIAINPFKFIGLGAGINYKIQKYTKNIPVAQNINFVYAESAQYINFPLYIKLYLITNKIINIELLTGIEFQNIIKASFTYKYTNNTGKNLAQAYTTSDINIHLSNRNRFRPAGFVAARIGFSLQRIGLFSEIKYIADENFYNKPDNQLYNYHLNIENGFISDNLKINTIEISAGISYNLIYKITRKY